MNLSLPQKILKNQVLIVFMAIQLFENNFVLSKLQFHREVLSHGVLELNVIKKAGIQPFFHPVIET